MAKIVEASENIKKIGLLLISFFGGIITSTLTDIVTDLDRTLTIAVSLVFVVIGIILLLIDKIKTYKFYKELGKTLGR